MTTEDMIREVRRLEKKHKNDKVYTFGNDWSAMCHDVANKLEELQDEINSLNKQLKTSKEDTLDSVKEELDNCVVTGEYPNGVDYRYISYESYIEKMDELRTKDN